MVSDRSALGLPVEKKYIRRRDHQTYMSLHLLLVSSIYFCLVGGHYSAKFGFLLGCFVLRNYFSLAGGPYGMLGIEPVLSVCKRNAGLSLQFLVYAFVPGSYFEGKEVKFLLFNSRLQSTPEIRGLSLAFIP